MAYIDYTVERRLREANGGTLEEVFKNAPCYAALQGMRAISRYKFSDIKNIKVSLESLHLKDIELIRKILDDFGYLDRYCIAVGEDSYNSIFDRYIEVNDNRPMVNIFMLYVVRFFIENGERWVSTVRDLISGGIRPSLAILVGANFNKNDKTYTKMKGGHGFLNGLCGISLNDLKHSFPKLKDTLDTSPVYSRDHICHSGFDAFIGGSYNLDSGFVEYIIKPFKSEPFEHPKLSLKQLISQSKKLQEEIYG